MSKRLVVMFNVATNDLVITFAVEGKRMYESLIKRGYKPIHKIYGYDLSGALYEGAFKNKLKGSC